MSRSILKLFVMTIVLILFQPLPATSAQNATILTVALPDWINNTFGETIFDEFEAQHSNVQVIIVPPETISTGLNLAYNLDSYLTNIQTVTRNSDVIYVSNGLHPEATLASQLLDLQPLITTDEDMNPEDFYSAIWNSFKWDGGTWAIPLGATFWALSYDPVRFENANLAYPNGSWTAADFEAATESLSIRTPEGILPGFAYAVIDHEMVLMRSLSESNFADLSTIPAQPAFAQQNIADMVETISMLRENNFYQQNNFVRTDFMANAAMYIAPLDASTEGGLGGGRRAAPLPGNNVGVRPSGFAVSAGTAHPELAYELVKYLTTRPEIVTISGIFASPALRHVEFDATPFRPEEPDPEIQALINLGREHGLSYADMRYAHYVWYSYFQYLNEGTDPLTILEDYEQFARDNMREATERWAQSTFQVDPPVVYSTDTQVLNLGIWSEISPLQNLSFWQNFADDFAVETSAIDYIHINTSRTAENLDCVVPLYPIEPISFLDQTSLLDTTPLTATDPDFREADYLLPVHAYYENNSTTYGVPIGIHPIILWYDANTIEENMLGDLFQSLVNQRYSESVTSPLIHFRVRNGYDLLSLVYASGAEPFDLSTSPPEVMLTSSLTATTIETVIFLADNGIILSNQLPTSISTDQNIPPLFTSSLDARDGNFSIFWDANSGYQPTFFTTPSNETILSYWISEGYIYADSAFVDTCYALFRAISARPDLYSGVPIRYSDLQAFTLPAHVQQFYTDLAAHFESGETIKLPYRDYAELTWLRDVIVSASNDQTDLESEIATLSEIIALYHECLTNQALIDNLSRAYCLNEIE